MIYVAEAQRNNGTICRLGFLNKLKAEEYLGERDYTLVNGYNMDFIDLMKDTLAKEIGEDAKILKFIKAHEWHLGLVLVDRKTEFEPYVTWIFNASMPGFSTGHYFNNIDEARNDFRERMKLYGP